MKKMKDNQILSDNISVVPNLDGELRLTFVVCTMTWFESKLESCLDDALGDEPQAPGSEGHRVEGDAGDELDEGGDRVHRQRVDQLALGELKCRCIDCMIGQLDNPRLCESRPLQFRTAGSEFMQLWSPVKS